MAITRRGRCDGFGDKGCQGFSVCCLPGDHVLLVAVPGQIPAAGGGSPGTILLAVHAMGVKLRGMRGETKSFSDSWTSPTVEV